MHPMPLVADATAAAADVVRAVRPTDLGAPTPCQDWDVETLLNHLLQVADALALAGRGDPVPNDLWQRTTVTADRVASFEDAVRRAVAAWSDPAAPGRTVAMGPMQMPAAFVATMLASDLVIHGWDLARATGRDFRCADADAEAVLGFVRETAEQGREMNIYGEPVAVPADATALDRALALSGRDPGWSPGQ